MKKYTNIFLILFVFAFYSIAKAQNTQGVAQNEPTAKENIAYKWAKMALLATANDTEKFKPRPTITSRYLGLSFIAIFDAWSRYDNKAIPVYLNKVDRQAPVDRTLNNKEIAVSYAAYRALSKYFYSDKKIFYDFMIELGLDPDNFSLDPNTPEGIGNLAATAVFEARKNDGSNQDGEEVGSNGKAYFDYIKYTAINSADDNTDINHWQPKYFSDGKGGQYLPECLTPFWGKVKPVSLKSASQFRPIPPPLVGSEKLKKEVEEVIKLQENLTNEQKALVEFMRDGPMSVQQAGHWLTLAQEVSVRDNHTLDEDVRMYFLCEITAMDCFIACWDSKLFYDYARPYALVHHYYKNIIIKAWGGPGKGIVEMKGENWRPYSPDTFLCPSFQGYVSGHSTISGGCAEALRLFTGNDYFGSSVDLIPGLMTEPDHIGEKVTLQFPTFTETANMAGNSRVLGGYHIQSDNIEGLKLGRKVAHEAWDFYNIHLGLK
jgi:hypothetical protein